MFFHHDNKHIPSNFSNNFLPFVGTFFGLMPNFAVLCTYDIFLTCRAYNYYTLSYDIMNNTYLHLIVKHKWGCPKNYEFFSIMYKIILLKTCIHLIFAKSMFSSSPYDTPQQNNVGFSLRARPTC